MGAGSTRGIVVAAPQHHPYSRERTSTDVPAVHPSFHPTGGDDDRHEEARSGGV
jgi:hypothetical protein